MDFGWGDGKNEKNMRERNFGFAYASRIFRGDVVEWVDKRFD